MYRNYHANVNSLSDERKAPCGLQYTENMFCGCALWQLIVKRTDTARKEKDNFLFLLPHYNKT